MLPIGQLDGGHVLYGLVTRRQAALGWLALGVLLILGFQSLMWWLFAAIGLIMGVAHPKTLNDSQPLTSAARIMGWVSIIILLLSFTPVPFAVSLFD
jgi:membrane-associated protease RseP (regulator of RpoE activity)